MLLDCTVDSQRLGLRVIRCQYKHNNVEGQDQNGLELLGKEEDMALERGSCQLGGVGISRL